MHLTPRCPQYVGLVNSAGTVCKTGCKFGLVRTLNVWVVSLLEKFTCLYNFCIIKSTIFSLILIDYSYIYILVYSMVNEMVSFVGILFTN